MLGRLRQEARAIPARKLVKDVAEAYGRNDLLTFASAIAFQVMFALIPLFLFALALMSGVGLDAVWTDELAPALQKTASPAAFEVIDSTVRKVLSDRQGFWLTIGAAITIWEMSGAVRAIMDVFDRIYDVDAKRTWKQRYTVSIALSIETGLLLLGAVAVIELGQLVLGGPFVVLRYVVAIALLSAAIHLLVRHAPSETQPAGWVTFGSAIVVVAWLGTSAVYTFYLTNFAQYGSIFGAAATVIITFQYLYLGAIAFLTGAQVDALLREHLETDEVETSEESTRWTPVSSTS